MTSGVIAGRGGALRQQRLAKAFHHLRGMRILRGRYPNALMAEVHASVCAHGWLAVPTSWPLKPAILVAGQLIGP